MATIRSSASTVRPADRSLVGAQRRRASSTPSIPPVAPRRPLAAAIDPALEAAAFGFDFNPTVDRIRVDVQHRAEPAPQPRHRRDRHQSRTPAHRRSTASWPIVVGDPNAGTAPQGRRRGVHQLRRRGDPDAAVRRRRGNRHAGDPEPAERRDPQHRRAARRRSSRRRRRSTSPPTATPCSPCRPVRSVPVPTPRRR